MISSRLSSRSASLIWASRSSPAAIWASSRKIWAFVMAPERAKHLAGREDAGTPRLRGLVPLDDAGALGADVAEHAQVDRVGVETDDGAVGAELEGIDHGRSGGLHLPRRGGAGLLVVFARALAVCGRTQQVLRLS